MNRLCTALRISSFLFLSAILLLLSGTAHTQVPALDIHAFYRHLKHENLLLEQIALAHKLRKNLPHNSDGADSLSLDLATAYLKLNMRDSSISNLYRISSPNSFPESKKQLYFSSLLLSGLYDIAGKQSGMNLSPSFSAELNTSLVILKRGSFMPYDTDKQSSLYARDVMNSYAVTPRYSPFWAGAFSAVLPGAGKWYIGYKRQAVTAFIANLMFAAQAAESYAKAGARSPQFIITAGLFGIFYSGNIWGSVLAAKKKTRDHLKQLDHEILDHYTAEFTRLSR